MTSQAREMLAEEFADEWADEEQSGIRTRDTNDLTIVFLSDPTEQPAPVYAVLADLYGAFHSYYLGMLFPTGVMVAAHWEWSLQRDGVSPEAIASVREWLAARAL
ncbi:MAG TPA: hypothetical protein VFB62_13850 [Polyangiaceae bacterium]|nr:hypothetical protein [Polyangiaceae bacterium]